MSYRVGIKKLTELSSNVVTWFNAADINLPIGSFVNSLTGREGKDSATTPYSNIYTLELDSQGYKYLKSTAVVSSFNTSQIVTANNNETFIGVLEVEGSISASFFHDGTSITCGSMAFSYANYINGNGRIIYPNIINKKRVITGVMTPGGMTVYDGFSIVGYLASPALLTKTAVGGVFRSDSNTSNFDLKYYAAARIQEALTGEKLKQAIRSVAFENGVKI